MASDGVLLTGATEFVGTQRSAARGKVIAR
jgi:hypothetical protein